MKKGETVRVGDVTYTNYYEYDQEACFAVLDYIWNLGVDRKRGDDSANELKTRWWTGQVNLNTASRLQLQSIQHIGPARADAIINERPWQSVDQLIRISGIGETVLQDIKAEDRLICE